ncbi:MAG: hypothetical protein AB7O45_00475 [Alphaproteobacteria bacterium]
MLTIKCPTGRPHDTKVCDKDGRDLTAALSIESIHIEIAVDKPARADLHLSAIENTDLAEIPGRWLLRNPATNVYAPIREVQWADGTTTRFTPDGFVTVLPASAAA